PGRPEVDQHGLVARFANHVRGEGGGRRVLDQLGLGWGRETGRTAGPGAKRHVRLGRSAIGVAASIRIVPVAHSCPFTSSLMSTHPGPQTRSLMWRSLRNF